MEAYDDLISFGGSHKNKTENNFSASSAREDSWQEYEDSVLADERGKAKMLTAIKTAQRSRGTSLQNLAEFRELERTTSGDFRIPDNDFEAKDLDEVTKHLFQAMPEPYPHPVDYQRVIITETGDSVDRDTVNACKSIKRCMDLRMKYMSAHNTACQPVKPSMQRTATDEYRRRTQPEYDVFNRPLPPATNEYEILYNKGVFSAKKTEPADSVLHSAIPFEEFFADFNFV
jgi:hypothetical protein